MTDSTSMTEVNRRLVQLEELTNVNAPPGSVLFKESDRVEVNWQGRGVWYASKIKVVKDDGTYDITYDVDNSVDVGVTRNLIRYIDPQIHITNIFTKLNDFENRIASVNTSGSSNPPLVVENKIDDIINRISRLEEGSASKTSNVEYKEGDKVEGNYRGRGKWYQGKISRVRDNGYYDISYHDGEIETRVFKDCLRSVQTDEQPVVSSNTLDEIMNRLKTLEDNQNATSNSTPFDPKAFNDLVNKVNSIEKSSQHVANNSTPFDSKAFNDLVKKVKSIEDGSQNTTNNNTPFDPKAFNDLVKKVNKIEDNINKAMGDVFERLRIIEKSLPASSKIADFDNYMKKNNEALMILQGKVTEMERKEKRPSSKKDRRKSTSDSIDSEAGSVRPFSSQGETVSDKTKTKSDKSSTSTKTSTSTKASSKTSSNTNDDWEVSSVKTESDPIEIAQAGIDAIKVLSTYS